MESSLTRVAAAAMFRIDGQMHNAQNCAEPVKPEIERSDQEVTAEAAKCSDQKEHLEKLLGFDESTTSQPPQSHSVNHGDESDHVDDEVCIVSALAYLKLYWHIFRSAYSSIALII